MGLLVRRRGAYGPGVGRVDQVTRKHRTVTLARSLCRVCAKTWEGANAQAVAARHTDATSHATRVEVNMVVEYGEEPENQPGLFDGVTQ